MESHESTFQGINLDGLVRRLDKHISLSDKELEFGLGTLKDEDKAEAEIELGESPFFHELSVMALRPIKQQGYSLVKIMDNLLKSEENIGYAFVESGESLLATEKPEQYQMLVFRIREPLVLKNQKKLPESKINVFAQYREEEGFYKKALEKRADYVKIGSGIWVKRDLSEILPTRWFFSPGYPNYKAHQLQTTGPY